MCLYVCTCLEYVFIYVYVKIYSISQYIYRKSQRYVYLRLVISDWFRDGDQFIPGQPNNTDEHLAIILINTMCVNKLQPSFSCVHSFIIN